MLKQVFNAFDNLVSLYILIILSTNSFVVLIVQLFLYHFNLIFVYLAVLKRPLKFRHTPFLDSTFGPFLITKSAPTIILSSAT